MEPGRPSLSEKCRAAGRGQPCRTDTTTPTIADEGVAGTDPLILRDSPADPAQLRLLALIRRTRSQAATSTVLGITPAAVSQQLTRAERDWGVQLVTRGHRGAALTPAGAVLADHGDLILDACATARERLARHREATRRRLRIGCFEAAATVLLPPVLTALRHREAAEMAVVDVTTEQGADIVAQGAVDVAILASYGDPIRLPRGVEMHPLFEDPLVVVLPDDHRLVRERPAADTIGLEELRDEAWVAINPGRAARLQLDGAAQRTGFTPRVEFHTESYGVAQSLVSTGMAIGVVSRLSLTNLDGVAHRTLVRPALGRKIFAATRESSPLPLLAEFLRLLRRSADDLAMSGGAIRWPASGPWTGVRADRCPT